MNKKTKLLLVLLSSTALTAGAFGLAACSGEAHNEEYYAQYQQYVSATAEGEVLSYEDWLIGILEDAKGEKGDKGDTGEAGKAGTQWTVGEVDPAATAGADGDFYLNKTTFDVYNKANGTWTKIGSIKGSDGAAGATGNGIDTIVYKDGALEVSLTSGDKITVALPDEITHVHTYGENITVVVPSTLENEGIGYKKCTQNGCEHIELVAIPIPKYNITVSYAGAPLANANVTISGKGISDEGTVAAQTDKDGKVTLSVLALGEYTLSVDGYTIIGNSKTSSTTTDQTIEVAKTIGADGITEAGTYAVVVSSQIAKYPWGDTYEEIIPQEVSLKAGAQNTSIKVTPSSTDSIFLNSSNSQIEDIAPDGSYTAIIRKGETSSVNLSVDQAYFDSGKYEYGDTIIYSIKVEYLAAPAEGTVEELSLDGSALTEAGLTKTAEADQWIYYTWTTTNTEYSKLKFTLGADNTLEFTSYQNFSNVTVSPDADGVLIYSDNEYRTTFNFRVKSASGNISVGAEYYAAPGEKIKPISMDNYAFGTELTGKAEKKNAVTYYKWVADRSGEIVLEGKDVTNADSTSSSTEISIYKDISAKMPQSEFDVSDGIGFYNVVEGETYYFGIKAIGSALDYNFQIRTYNATTDDGFGAAHPLAITGADYALDNFAGTKYLKYTNDTEKEVWLQLIDDESDYSSISFYSAVTTLEENAEGAVEMDMKSRLSYESYYKAGLKPGESVYIVIEAYSYDPMTRTFSNYINEVEQVTDTFTVVNKELEPVAGVEVLILGDGNETIASGTTNEEGVATITYSSGKYSIGVTEGEYKINDTMTTDYHKAADTQEYSVSVVGKTTYTVTVLGTDGTTGTEGVTVTVYDSESAEVATGTTDSEGKFTFNEFADRYTVKFGTLPENTTVDSTYLTSTVLSATVELIPVTPVTAGTTEEPADVTMGYTSFAVSSTAAGWFSYTAAAGGNYTITLTGATIGSMTLGEQAIITDGVLVDTYGDYTSGVDGKYDEDYNSYDIVSITVKVSSGAELKYSVVSESAEAVTAVAYTSYEQTELSVGEANTLTLGYGESKYVTFNGEEGHTYQIAIGNDDSQSVRVIYGWLVVAGDDYGMYNAEGTVECTFSPVELEVMNSGYSEIEFTITITDVTE